MASAASRPAPLATGAWWLIACLVFLALPLAIIGLGLDSIWSDQERLSRERLFEELDDVLGAIANQKSTEAALEGELVGLARYLQPGQAGPGAFELGLADLSGRFPGLLDFARIASDGSIASCPDRTRFPPDGLQGLVPVIAALATGSSDPSSLLEEALPAVRRTFGTLISPAEAARLLRGGCLLEVSTEPQGRYACFFRGTDWSWWIRINRLPGWTTLFHRDACARMLQTRPIPGLDLGVVDPALPPGKLAPALEKVLAEFPRSILGHFTEGESSFAVAGIGENAILWAARPRNQVVDHSPDRRSFFGVAFVLFLLLAWLAFRIIVQRDRLPIPLGLRLVFLFLFAGGVPLLVVVLTGWEYLRGKYQVGRREFQREVRRVLEDLGTRFPQHRGEMEENLRNALEATTRGEGGRPAAIGVLEKIGERFHPRLGRLYDLDGKLVWEQAPRGAGPDVSPGDLLDELLPGVAGLLGGGPAATGSSLAMPHPAGLDLARRLDRLAVLPGNAPESWIFLGAVRDRTGSLTHLAALSWSKGDLERTFLEASLPLAHQALPDTTVLAWNPAASQLLPATLATLLPRLTPFLREPRLKRGAAVGRLDGDGGTYLLTGLQPRELSENVLVAMRSDQPLRLEITTLNRRIWWFVALMVLVDLGLGILLARRILTPIAELEGGLKALRIRDFQARVPPGDPDEMGRLLEAFNSTMIGMGELEVARIVQESLTPEGELEVGEYRMHGRTLPSRRVGGDCFDLHQLPDGKVLIMIGDVAGHGVPAALVMAMAKGVILTRCPENPSPEQVLIAVNQVLARVLRRRRLMTCLVCVLDPVSHRWEGANAGHLNPFFTRAGFPPQEVSPGLGTFPLGVRPNLSPKPMLGAMGPGDWLVFFTAGFPEAPRDGGTFGMEPLLGGMARFLDREPRDASAGIFSWHASATGLSVPEDDLTLVLVRRRPQPRNGQPEGSGPVVPPA